MRFGKRYCRACCSYFRYRIPPVQARGQGIPASSGKGQTGKCRCRGCRRVRCPWRGRPSSIPPWRGRAFPCLPDLERLLRHLAAHDRRIGRHQGVPRAADAAGAAGCLHFLYQRRQDAVGEAVVPADGRGSAILERAVEIRRADLAARSVNRLGHQVCGGVEHGGVLDVALHFEGLCHHIGLVAGLPATHILEHRLQLLDGRHVVDGVLGVAEDHAKLFDRGDVFRCGRCHDRARHLHAALVAFAIRADSSRRCGLVQADERIRWLA